MLVRVSSLQSVLTGICTNKPCKYCEDRLFEAWERMTFGGVVVVQTFVPFERRPADNTCPPYYEPFVDEHEPLRTLTRGDSKQTPLSGTELDLRMRAILEAVTPETSFSSVKELVNLGFGIGSFSIVRQVLDAKKRKAV